jgi:hypothetical protein
MAEKRSREGTEYAWMNETGARTEEQATWWNELLKRHGGRTGGLGQLLIRLAV